jgi:hypothetical protein
VSTIEDPVLPVQFKSGQALSARSLNRLVSGIVRARPAILSPQQIAVPQAGAVLQVNVVEQGGDWLKVLTWNGADEGTDLIYVAKPYLLRRSRATWYGITYTYTTDSERTATKGVDTETQVIVPAYVADDVLYIVRPYGGTDTVDDDDQPIVWLDLNVDGRAWAKEAP